MLVKLEIVKAFGIVVPPLILATRASSFAAQFLRRAQLRRRTTHSAISSKSCVSIRAIADDREIVPGVCGPAGGPPFLFSFEFAEA